MATRLQDFLDFMKSKDTVVRVDDILEKLGSRLTAAEKEDLLLSVLRPSDQVRPGDLITADIINKLLADLGDLQVRVADLERRSTGGVEPGPVVGGIDLSHQASARGTNVVPKDPQPFPHKFAVINGTDTDLAVRLIARISGGSGDWSRAVLFDSGDPTHIVSVSKASQKSVEVHVTAPGDAVLGEKVVLTLTAFALGLTATKSLLLTVSDKAGDEVLRTLNLESVLVPGDFATTDPGIDGKVPSGQDRTLTFRFKYDDGSVTPPDPGFELVVKLESANPANSLSQWGVMPMGGSPDSDTVQQGVRTVVKRGVNLPRGQTTPVEVTLSAPSPAGAKATFTFAVRSTKLSKAIEKSKSYVVASS